MKNWLLSVVALTAFTLSAFGQKVPPTVELPRDEVVQPGTLAEAKAERVMGYGPKNVRVPEAWAEAISKFKNAKGRNVKIAILDTGGDKNHPWLKDVYKGEYNAINKTGNAFDGNNHGTHCAGIVAEAAPEVSLYFVKVLSDGGSGSVADIAHGVDYAVTELGVDVVSLSLGGARADQYIPPAFARAEKAGVLIICAAGNEGPRENTDGYPARYKEAYSIAASDERNAIANFSSRGASVYCNTPGVNIVSSLPGGRQGTMSGTSMATPLAAALACIWISANPEIKKTDRPAKYREVLKAACSHPDTRKTSDGFGLPDAVKLLGSGTGTPPVTPPDAFRYTITFQDLSAARQAELKALGVNEFTLTLGGVSAGKIPVPTPMPTAPSVGTPWTSESNCPGGVCPTPGSQGTRQILPNFQPFGGFFRRGK